jgi:hypothetical protein
MKVSKGVNAKTISSVLLPKASMVAESVPRRLYEP